METILRAGATRRTFLQTTLAGACALALAGCGGGNRQNNSRFDRSRATKLVTDYAATFGAFGMGVAVVRGNELLWSSGFGTANRERKLPATADTPFLIASVSKTVTAVAMMQLVESGKLNLDADINTYLPFGVRNPNFPGEPITPRQLLAHVSGISDAHFDTIAEAQFYYKNEDPRLSLADFCRGIFAPGGQFYDAATYSASAPGQTFAYSNIGYALIGYIVERAAGLDFAAHTKRTLFAPLGMNRTSWRVADFPADDLAMMYSATGEPYGNVTFADYPDGAVRTSVNDLSRFLRMFISGGTRLLTKASVDEMKRLQYPNTTQDGIQLGLGWNLGAGDGGSPLLGHDGLVAGAITVMRYSPVSNAGVILFQNTSPSPNAADDVQALAGYTLARALIALGETA